MSFEIRPEFTKMLEDEGCPRCQSLDTYEAVVSITATGGKTKDDVPACLCDECGHVELKYQEDESRESAILRY